MLNRPIIIIKSKKLFLSLSPSLTEPENKISFDEIDFDNTSYLLPAYEINGTRKKSYYYDIIF